MARKRSWGSAPRNRPGSFGLQRDGVRARKASLVRLLAEEGGEAQMRGTKVQSLKRSAEKEDNSLDTD